MSRANASPASLEDARAELETINEQTAHTGLQDALDIRAAKEEALHAARLELDDLTAKLRAADETRLTAERALQPLRDRINELQLKEQAARLNGEQFIEQLAAAGVDEAELAGQAHAGHEAVVPARRSHAHQQRDHRARARSTWPRWTN